MWTQGKTWIDRRKRHKQHKWIFPSLSTFNYIVLNHIVSTQATMWDGYHFSSNLSRFWGTPLNDTEGLVRSWNVLIPQHLWNPHVTQGRYLFGDITSWCCSGSEWCNGTVCNAVVYHFVWRHLGVENWWMDVGVAYFVQKYSMALRLDQCESFPLDMCMKVLNDPNSVILIDMVPSGLVWSMPLNVPDHVLQSSILICAGSM